MCKMVKINEINIQLDNSYLFIVDQKNNSNHLEDYQ